MSRRKKQRDLDSDEEPVIPMVEDDTAAVDISSWADCKTLEQKGRQKHKGPVQRNTTNPHQVGKKGQGGTVGGGGGNKTKGNKSVSPARPTPSTKPTRAGGQGGVKSGDAKGAVHHPKSKHHESGEEEDEDAVSLAKWSKDTDKGVHRAASEDDDKDEDEDESEDESRRGSQSGGKEDEASEHSGPFGWKVAGRGKGKVPLLVTFMSTQQMGTVEGGSEGGGGGGGGGKGQSIRTVFAKEDDDVIAARKARTRLPLVRCGGPPTAGITLSRKARSQTNDNNNNNEGDGGDDGKSALTSSSGDKKRSKCFNGVGLGSRYGAPISPDFFRLSIDIPIRPPWHRGMTPAQLHARESEYFLNYLSYWYGKYTARRLNHFEHNLNVWRQLWRVCERSDILILVADSRHPLLHFNAGLYRYVTEHLNKPLVFLLNKVDLVPLATLRRWQSYFNQKYPSMHVVLFSSYPSAEYRVALAGTEQLTSTPSTTDSSSSTGADPNSKHPGNNDKGNNGENGNVDLLQLASHAKQVVKSKRSPLLNPIGTEALLKACREILVEHQLNQRKKAEGNKAGATTQVDKRHDDQGKKEGERSGESGESESETTKPEGESNPDILNVVDKLSFAATRLLTEKDAGKLAMLKEKGKKEADEIRKKEALKQAYIKEKEKKAKGKHGDDDEEEDEDDDQSGEDEEDDEEVSEATRGMKGLSVKGKTQGRGGRGKGGDDGQDEDDNDEGEGNVGMQLSRRQLRKGLGKLKGRQADNDDDSGYGRDRGRGGRGGKKGSRRGSGGEDDEDDLIKGYDEEEGVVDEAGRKAMLLDVADDDEELLMQGSGDGEGEAKAGGDEEDEEDQDDSAGNDDDDTRDKGEGGGQHLSSKQLRRQERKAKRNRRWQQGHGGNGSSGSSGSSGRVTMAELKKNRITIGTIGHPNAGKSSLINALTGKKVVSVSRQPGHTKILQTLLINNSTILCDCPGLVFPAVDMPRELQVLAGIYPIPQAKEPVASVAYLAECIPIEDILELPVPQDTSSTSTLTKSNNNNNNKSVTSHGYTRDTYPWSGLSICEAYAKKRGFNLPHGRVDSNRAAQHILYAVADGTIPFYFEPPDLN